MSNSSNRRSSYCIWRLLSNREQFSLQQEDGNAASWSTLNQMAAQIVVFPFHLRVKVKGSSWMDDLAPNELVCLEKWTYNRPLNSKLIVCVIKSDVIISQLLCGWFWQRTFGCLLWMNNCRYLEGSWPSESSWQNLCFATTCLRSVL